MNSPTSGPTSNPTSNPTSTEEAFAASAPSHSQTARLGCRQIRANSNASTATTTTSKTSSAGSDGTARAAAYRMGWVRRLIPTAAATAGMAVTPAKVRASTAYPGTSTSNVTPNATRYAALLAGAAPLALVAATRAPLTVTVVGLIAFGILHNVLELRYVLGRFAGALVGSTGMLLLTLVTGIVLARLASSYLGPAGRTVEILLGYAVLAAGAWRGLGGRWRTATLATLAAATGMSLGHPAYHVVVLAHLHNLVPLVFLWEWATRLAPGRRRVFRAVQVGWVLVVPALVLGGLVDAVVDRSPGLVTGLVGDGSSVVAATTWPADSDHGYRWLVAFAFLQTMHYVVWVWFLPRAAPEATVAFERRWPALSAKRIWIAGVALGVLLAVLLLTDYSQGRTLYSALATYHAYLEFPVVLALFARGGIGDHLPRS